MLSDGDDGLVEIHVAHPTLSVDNASLRGLLRLAASGEGREIHALSVILTDHDTVLELNRAYLEHDYKTDVLSFDLRDEPDSEAIEGEVYVDLDTAADRCAEFGSTFEEEVFRYAVHGLLHLTGHSDETEEDRAGMRALEDRYLRESRLSRD